MTGPTVLQQKIVEHISKKSRVEAVNLRHKYVESVFLGVSLFLRGWPNRSLSMIQTYEVADAATCAGFFVRTFM